MVNHMVELHKHILCKFGKGCVNCICSMQDSYTVSAGLLILSNFIHPYHFLSAMLSVPEKYSLVSQYS